MSSVSQASSGVVHLSVDDGIALITIDNASRRNTMDLPMRDVFHDHLAAALSDDAVRVVILTGAGGNFCAGGDISGMNETALQCRRRLQKLHRIVRQIAYAEKPVIAATEGVVAGNGLSLAAASDFVVTASDAKFICAFVKIGLVPDTAALWYLPQRMGLGRAKLAMMTGETFSGTHAVRAGLADIEVTPGRALEEAYVLAEKLKRVGPLAVGMTKSLLARAPLSLEEALKAETDAQAILFTSQDFAEGRAAFREKRPARFEGR
ncbi:enoyl-CoA hydratase/isomerase family protein [Rhodoligotrophos defluvii]|uniref:enoyl-CoA hydratase/isomerase family protein n=1 Tax=Rhodoligotrophos defluvii TaxID=2561934 RepID=UPI001484F6F9|nr:enoyl-CoA hydratase/isomerase family protein [Rhodoligotrophos defluvii]